ncbi:MAG: UDP-N-acetylmuramoyl-tripeptide--D-alanyl-D-alanine ligase [Lachnospiraceae bacterium]|nr:UDP-N-acetylmuramoyl-tripeptide--D-alanyl-D-alanine ligase [Lachnospiraceae bacterium]
MTMIDMTIGEIAKAVGAVQVRGDENIRVKGVVIDSRDPADGLLFVPIVGEKTDAHEHIAGARANGAVATFISREDAFVPEGMGAILVEDTVRALQRLGEFYRRRTNVPLIGITGSVGKTTTKEMVHAALAGGLKVIKTIKNWNGQLGLPRMMLELDESLDAAVIEMGMSLEGEMARLSAIASPQTAVITNIGVSHIGNLGSREAIRREKLSIANGFEKGAYLLLNGDDDMLRPVVDAAKKVKENGTEAAFDGIEMTDDTRRALPLAKIETYGLGEDCDHRAVNTVFYEDMTEFDYVSKSHEGGTAAPVHVRLSTVDRAHLMNAVAAMAVAERFGVSLKTAAEGLLSYRPEGMRGEVEKVGEIKVINDAYNASPDSIKSGLDVLMKTPGARHIAVLADMLELGAMSKTCHETTGRDAAEAGVDILVTVGGEAEHIDRAAGLERPELERAHFDTNEDAYAYLKQTLRSGDVVLFKGSRGMKLEEIIGRLKESV